MHCFNEDMMFCGCVLLVVVMVSVVAARPCATVEVCVGVNETCTAPQQQCVAGICRRAEGGITLELEGHETLPPNRVVALVRVAEDGAPRTGLALSMFEVREDGIPLSEDSAVQWVPDAVQVAVHFLFHRSHGIRNTYPQWRPALADAMDQLRVTWPQADARLSYFSGADASVVVWNGTGGLPETLDDTVVDTSTNLHGALVDAFQGLQRASQHVRALVVWTDDVDRADRVASMVVRQVACETEAWIFLLDLNRQGSRLPHAWLPPLDGKVNECPVVDDMQTTDILHLPLFLSNAVSQLRHLATDLVVLAYCSPSRDHLHRTSIQVVGQPGTLVEFEFDARGFTSDTTCQGVQVAEPLLLHHLPTCARIPEVRPRREDTTTKDVIWVMAVTISVTVAGLFLLWLIYLLIHDWRTHGSWTVLPQTN